MFLYLYIFSLHFFLLFRFILTFHSYTVQDRNVVSHLLFFLIRSFPALRLHSKWLSISSNLGLVLKDLSVSLFVLFICSRCSICSFVLLFFFCSFVWIVVSFRFVSECFIRIILHIVAEYFCFNVFSLMNSILFTFLITPLFASSSVRIESWSLLHVKSAHFALFVCLSVCTSRPRTRIRNGNTRNASRELGCCDWYGIVIVKGKEEMHFLCFCMKMEIVKRTCFILLSHFSQ